MNGYYKVIDKIREIVNEQGIVNTVVHGKTEDKDLYKKSIYPLCHIVPLPTSMDSSQVSRFTFDISALDVRDLSSIAEEDKFEGNDNQQDNLNTTYQVINYLVTKLRLQENDSIELVGVSNVTPVLFSSHNLLDGWVVTLTLEVPNTIINVC